MTQTIQPQPERTAKLLLDRGLSIEVLLQKLALRPGDIAYISGSVVEGLGDASADLDLFVLTSSESIRERRTQFASERRALQERNEFGILYLNLDGIEIDAEYHAKDKFEELFESLRSLKPSRSTLWESFNLLGRFERPYALELLHRFRVGWPIGEPNVFEEFRLGFDEKAFIDWNVIYALMNCEDFAKGVRRSLREDDHENAMLKLRCFYDSLVDASLFAQGVSLDRWKWRLPKLRLLRNTALLEAYRRVQFHTSEDLRHFVEEALEDGVRVHANLLRRYE